MKEKLKAYGINFFSVTVSYLLFVFIIQTGLINGYMQAVIIFTCINIMVAISLNVATGILGQLALGHAGFMAIGAYSTGIFIKTMNLPKIPETLLGLLVGGLVAGIFGLIIGIPALRLKGDYLGIVTLGFAEIIRFTIINLRSITGGSTGLKAVPVYLDVTHVVFILILVVTFTFLFVRSRHGRAMISIRENEIAAEAIGVPTTFYKVYGFFISSFMAGIGGACFAMTQSYISPISFKFMVSVELLIIVVFGGMGSITGTIIAGTVLSLIAQFLYDYGEFRLVVYAVLLIVLMIFRPEGVFGRKEFSLVKLPDNIKSFIQFLKDKIQKISELRGD